MSVYIMEIHIILKRTHCNRYGEQDREIVILTYSISLVNFFKRLSPHGSITDSHFYENLLMSK